MQTPKLSLSGCKDAPCHNAELQESLPSFFSHSSSAQSDRVFLMMCGKFRTSWELQSKFDYDILQQVVSQMSVLQLLMQIVRQTPEAAACIFNVVVYFVSFKSQEKQMTSTYMQMRTY